MSDVNIPYQVQQLIDSMLNKKENIHLRGNYRYRLNEIKLAIEKSIRNYDTEVMTADISKTKRKTV